MARRILFILPILGFVAITAAFLWGLRPERDPRYLPTAMLEKPIPEFALEPVPGLDRPGLAADDLRTGAVHLVNFFASWCLPCRVEHPHLTALTEESGVPLFGINHKDKPADAKAWLDKLGNSYQRIGADAGRAVVDWGVYGMPETFVVDGEGRIRYHFRGPLTEKIIDRELRPLLEALK